MDNTLSFLGNDPGAVRYGNFINYYQFHPASTRINHLPNDIWTLTESNSNETCAVLDIGCNSGELTIELHNFLNKICKWKSISTLGIDIDNVLIDRAKEISIDSVEFRCMNILSKNAIETLKTHLAKMKKEKFDVLTCFSVTMWIHLNSGDDGLKHFIEQMCHLCKMLVIEPQPWKCYKSAVRRMKKSSEAFPLFSTLKIKQDVVDIIEKFIIDNKFVKKFQSTPSNWDRKIMIFCQSD